MLSRSLCASDDVFFIDILSRTTSCPCRVGSPPLSIIHPISTVSFHNVGAFCPRIREHTGVFTRIFGKSVKGYVEKHAGSAEPFGLSPVFNHYLSLALRRASAIALQPSHNPISVPTRAHMHQLRIITAALFRQTESEKQARRLSRRSLP